MTIASQTFTPTAGLSSFINPALFMVTVLCVKRSGLNYRLVTGAPGNMEVKYNAGLLIFQVGVPFNPGEKIWVLWKV